MQRLRERLAPFVLFSLLIAIARLHTYDEPLERDITTYAVIGHEFLRDRALYSDLWDHKPPAIHMTFALAEMIAGYGASAIYLLGVTAALVTLWGVMLAGAAMGTPAGWWAGAFWAVVSGDMMLQANQPNTEVFVNGSLVLGFALLARGQGRHRRPRAWCVGGLFALATLYKPVAFPIALLVLAAHAVASSDGEGSFRRRVADGLVALFVIALAWIILVAVFAWSGDLGSFWDAVFVYNRDYQRRGWALVGIRALFPPFVWFLAPLLAVAVLGGILGSRGDNRRLWILLGAYLGGSVLAVGLPGHAHPHYLQLCLPALCIGAGWGLETLMQRGLRFARILGVAILGACLAHELPTFGLTADQWSEAKYGATARYGRIFVTARDLAAKIDAVLQPNERFYEFGDETGLYFLTRRSPPAGLIYVYPILEGPLVAPLSTRLVASLKRERPELLIVSGIYASWDGDGIRLASHPALAEILADYRPRWLVRGSPDFLLFTLVGGALETRANQFPDAPQFRSLEQ